MAASPRLLPRRRARCFALAASLLVFQAGALQAAEPVAVELLLAVDCSSSVSTGEFELQMGGIAAAFRHPDVLTAIELAGPRGIAVSLMQWSSKSNQVQSVDWMHLRDAASADAFAERVLAATRAVGGGATAIGSAIVQGVRLIEGNGFTGQRRAIDISGDGTSNQGIDTLEGRDMAAALGISINGLAITNRDRLLGDYYGRSVIGGPNAFLLTATNYRDFARAMLRKLVIEISGPPVARAPATKAPRFAAN